MRIKPLDRVIVIIMLVAIIASFALVASATSYTSTLLLARGEYFTGSFRKYECPNNEINIHFVGTGSAGNNYQNIVELVERILLVFDSSHGYRYVGTDVNETWTDCGSGKYAFCFANSGTTDWASNAVYMRSN